MPLERLQNDLTVTLNGSEYVFLAGTDIEYYSNGSVKSGIMALDTLARVGNDIRKFKAGSRIEFDEQGKVKDGYVVDIRVEDDIVILSVSGSLESNRSLELEETINDKINKGYKKLIFDMSKVYYISSGGIRVFIATLRLLKDFNGRMVLCNLSSSVDRIVKIADLNGLFEILPTVEEAIESVRTGN